MGDEGRENNGGGTDCTGGILGNGFAIEVENSAVVDGNSAGSSCENFRTYKRRRQSKMSNSEGKLLEDGNVAADSVNQFPEKAVEDTIERVLHSRSCDRVSHPRIDSHASVRCLGDCPLNRWRNVALEQLYQSICEREGGLQGCLRDALHPKKGCRTSTKGEENDKFPLKTGWIANGTHGGAEGHVGATFDGSLTESNDINTEMCRRAFFDTVTSEKFAQLCCLLLENFQGIKVDNVLDISLMNSRMKEGAYERSPILFHSDMQQLWTKLQKIGAEMVALATSLSDKSKTYHEQFLTEKSVLDAKLEPTEACGVFCSCHRCGEKADGRDCLVCDLCEEMYHVSCIKPAVEEIPSKSWYCVKCTANGIVYPHDNCALCDKMNSSTPPNNGSENDAMENKEISAEIEENSSDLGHWLQCFKRGKNLHRCSVCRIETQTDNDYKVCGHPFCPHKYYHVSCLTNKQLSTYGPSWYCPSCLCRGCLTDQDDEKIVLCDGCDHAYHIYCMQPPRNSIPRGKWFCVKCDTGICQMRKAERAHESIQSKLRRRGEDGEGAFGNFENARKEEDDDELVDKSGGVDMLLTAARTLSYEEKMAAIELKILKGKEVLSREEA